jgi:polyisoprenoid-binding protein YceI
MIMKLAPLVLIALPLFAAPPAFAVEWTVDAAKSRLGFSGVQNGSAFQGNFDKWRAEISFDPAHPEAGHAKVTIDLASARTGDVQRDAALPQPEWFDATVLPQAVFESANFVAKGEGGYEAAGKLTIRGITQDVVLPFALVLTGDLATAKGHLTLMRTAFGVGQGVWSTAQWVALDVGVDVDLVATRIGG